VGHVFTARAIDAKRDSASVLKSKFVDYRVGNVAEAKGEAIKSQNKRLAQVERIAHFVDERFHGQHNTALYAAIGDLNDMEESPWIAPLTNSPHLVGAIAKTRPPKDRWTCYFRSRGRVQQIDCIPASKALAARVTQTYICRPELPYRTVNRNGEALYINRVCCFIRFTIALRFRASSIGMRKLTR
jgi:hypothetical protein